MNKLYCYTENGEIVGIPKELPERWKNVSGLNTKSDAALKSLGWLPLDIVAPPEYNPDEQYRSLAYQVNEDSVTPVYTLHDFLDVGRVGEWCSVKEGAITAGPFKCPKVWDGVQMYLLTEPEINAMDWYKYVDNPPAYDEDTQYLSRVNEVDLPVVNAVYTVNDYTEEQMTQKIDQAKTAKLAEIRGECETRILAVYPIWMQTNGANGLDPATDVDAMLADIGAMRTESNTCEDAVDAAETLAAVRAIVPTWPIEAEVI